MEIFFELLQMATGRRDTLSVCPASRDEWEALYSTVGNHNMLGVTFPAVDTLHDQVDVPLGVYSRWAMAAEKIAQKSAEQNSACKILYQKFLENGFRSCILKGQAAARLYPRPELRQSGDIDIWLEGDRQKVVDFLRSRFPVKKVVYHHCDVQILKGMGVEVHFTPSWMNNSISNARLQRWFSEHSAGQFSNFDSRLEFCVPTLSFDAVYMLIHIYRHVLEEGIGLRQLLDYYYLLQNLTDADRQAAVKELKQLKLLRFAGAVMFVLQEVFGMQSDVMYVAPEAGWGSFLLDEILRSGNFGRHDPRNSHKKGEGILAHTFRKLKRNLRFLRYFPSEVLSMPFFMCWQYLWRRKHNYLYKGR